MSNKRNHRRMGQAIRHERSRKPPVITKAMQARADLARIERERKQQAAESERFWRTYKPAYRRWNRLGLPLVPSWKRKPRRVYGRTFWSHSHDA